MVQNLKDRIEEIANETRAAADVRSRSLLGFWSLHKMS